MMVMAAEYGGGTEVIVVVGDCDEGGGRGNG